jgi:pyridoxal phosphate enzyme (YggS family)
VDHPAHPASSPDRESAPSTPPAPSAPSVVDTAVAARLAEIRTAVDDAARQAGRDPADVRILLATKTVEPARILAAIRAGYPLIGENRAQEVTAKAAALAATPHQTHFIGHLQPNKINHLLGLVSCVQTVDSPSLAGKLQRALERRDATVDVMLQVNVSGEPTKSGVAPDAAIALFDAIAGHDRLVVRGLMTIGLNSPDPVAVRAGYARLRELRDEIAGSGRPGAGAVVELSMGMSGDFPDAIAEGATIVRVGSAVFGARTAR